MTDTPLLDWTPPPQLPVGGATYDPKRDGPRLSRQAVAVYALMQDGRWWTPSELEAALGWSWASIGARLRDFRKPEFYVNGTVEREHVADGLFRYRLVLKGANHEYGKTA